MGQKMPEIDTEREAWTLILNGAESHVEDALPEDEHLTPEEHWKVVDRAMELIREIREEKDVAW